MPVGQMAPILIGEVRLHTEDGVVAARDAGGERRRRDAAVSEAPAVWHRDK
jgi:hypothetical protein